MNRPAFVKMLAWLVGVLWLIAVWHLQLRGRGPSVDEPERTRPTGIRRRAVGKAFAGLLATLICLTFAISVLTEFRHENKAPAPPPKAGSVELFFDQPGIRAALEVRIENPESSPSYNYFISVTGPASLSRVGFSLAMQGHAEPTYVYPNGDPLPKDFRDCPPGGISVVPDMDHTCYKGQGDPTTTYADPGDRPSMEVLHGVLGRNSAGFMFGTVMVYSRSAITFKVGKRTLFDFPEIGTAYLPAGHQEKVKLDLGSDHPVYAPASLSITVDAGDLGIADRQENISPTIVAPPHLAWTTTSLSTIHAQGMYVDTTAEDEAASHLFLLGVYAAALSALLLSTLTFTVKEGWKGITGQA
jgi:hypothetical protein